MPSDPAEGAQGTPRGPTWSQPRGGARVIPDPDPGEPPARSPVHDLVSSTRWGVDAPEIQRLARLILVQARRKGAEAIHLDPGPPRVRFRVDGSMATSMEPPPDAWDALVDRLLLMAGVDVAETRLPQDGRIVARIEGRVVHMRVSTSPTTSGRKVLVRFLQAAPVPTTLEEQGHSPWVLERFAAAVAGGRGIVAVAGPTGAGKTTTQYASITGLARGGARVITIECPPEARLAGVDQRAVAWRDMPAAARAAVAEGADVVMAKLEDAELASALLDQARAGRLAIGSIHCGSAACVPIRLIDCGLPAGSVAAGLSLVQGQRLLRTLCPTCRELRPLDPGLRDYAGIDAAFLARVGLGGRDPGGLTVGVPVGCHACEGLGYRGRVPVGEALVVSPEIRALLRRGASVADLERRARAEGMIPMREDALGKALRGLLSLVEVARVLGLAP